MRLSTRGGLCLFLYQPIVANCGCEGGLRAILGTSLHFPLSCDGAEKNDPCGKTPQESRFLLFVLAEKHLSTGSKTSQRLNFAGDNDLGGLTVGGGCKGFQRFNFDDLVAGSGFVQKT